MISLPDEIQELYDNDIGCKQIILEFYKNDTDTTPSYTLTNDNIISESMELNEGLSTSQNIKFGQCYSSRFSIDIFNLKSKFNDDPDFINYKLKAYIYIQDIDRVYPSGYTQDDSKIQLFTGYVTSSVLSNNRNNRKITAYDILQYKLQTDISDLFFNDLLESRTIKYIRETILSTLNIPYESVSLPNDNIVLQKDIFKDTKNYKIIARQALESILEFSGCFGHIDRSGTFKFIKITSPYFIYPTDTTSENILYPNETLYPGTISESLINKYKLNTYISVRYGEFKTAPITGVEFISKDNIVIDRYTKNYNNVYSSKGNVFIDNILTISEIINDFSEPLYQEIYKLQYVPTELQCSGKPYLEVGDYISFTVNNDDSPKSKEILIPILSRTLKGIQSLKDNFSAKGTEKRQYIYKI